MSDEYTFSSIANKMKWFEEMEELYAKDDVNKFVVNVLGRIAYEAVYESARIRGLTPDEANEVVQSKWARHHEDELKICLVDAITSHVSWTHNRLSNAIHTSSRLLESMKDYSLSYEGRLDDCAKYRGDEE